MTLIELKKLCEERRIGMHETASGALRLIGEDVDVTVSRDDVRWVRPADLAPYRPRKGPSLANV